MGRLGEMERGRERVGETEAAVDGLGRGVGGRAAAAGDVKPIPAAQRQEQRDFQARISVPRSRRRMNAKRATLDALAPCANNSL